MTLLAVFVPQQSAVQQFYLRIVAGLSAAGIAAVIPGFFEIKMRWLRNSIRAGGALGVFTLIYMLNPPTISDAKPVVQAALAPDVSGTWDYSCTTLGAKFPHGGVRHGGQATIRLEPTPYGINVSMSGTRTWTEADGQRKAVDPPGLWQTLSGTFTGPMSLQYDYKTADPGEAIFGHSDVRITASEGRAVRMEGTFQRSPPYGEVYGSIVYVRP
ncbi:MAG: hypothetical protein SF066_00615 [Thermoanaerobaculia bacterium]|nr:hypothetical protein [Thermoanaerobaculia bacterium]